MSINNFLFRTKNKFCFMISEIKIRSNKMAFVIQPERSDDEQFVNGFTEDGRFVNGHSKERYSIEAVVDQTGKQELPFFTCYLFLMPYFCITREPIQPEHSCPYPAPFVIRANQAAIQPAYLVRQGLVHYGYQIVFSRATKIYLTVSFHNKKPERHLFDVEYQLLRFQVFDNHGSLQPCSYMDITFEYAGIPLRRRPPFGKLNFNTKLPHPIPYNQSPVPLLDYPPLHAINQMNNAFKWAYFPHSMTIGNLDGLFHGSYFPNVGNEIKQIVLTLSEPHANLTSRAKALFDMMPPGRNDYADHWRSIRKNLVTPMYALSTLIHTNPNEEDGYSDSLIDSIFGPEDIAVAKDQGTQTEPGELFQIDTMRAIISAIIKINPTLLADIDAEKMIQVTV